MAESTKTVETQTITEAVARIKVMEQHLQNINAMLPIITELQAKLQNLLPEYRALSEYYSSEKWFNDYDLHAAGKLPTDLACGVISEDLAYDCLGDVYQLALQQLSLATRLINPDETSDCPKFDFGK